MPLVVNTNVSSLTAQRHLSRNTTALGRSVERLASGLRINRAGDDAAGLQVSENLRAQIRGSQKALDNVQDGLNLLNIADGVLSTVESNIQRMRELSVQAANDTYDTQQRDAIVVEYNQLSADITRMFAAVEFNGVQLFNGGGPASFILQVGANDSIANDTVDLIASGVPFFGGQSAADIDGTGTIDVTAGGATVPAAWTTAADARLAITETDAAIVAINTMRGALGAVVNRLENSAENLMIGIENLKASESRIRDVDVAAESARLTQNQILQQAASTVLSQANQQPSLALQLLQG